MSTCIISYLTFQGNCREAMTFYKECFGGELVLQTLGNSPLAGKMPAKLRRYILNSTLSNGNLILIGSDMVPETGLIWGNTISLMLNCGTETEAHTYYSRLSADGVVVHPLEATFRGALFADLTDKFGHHWLLNYEKHQSNKSVTTKI